MPVELHFADVPVESHFDDVQDVHESPQAHETHAAQDVHTAQDVHAPLEAPPASAQATHVEHEAPPHDDTPGSISFSFSADDPADVHESFDASSDHRSPDVWTPAPTHVAETAAPSPAFAQAPAAPVPEPVSAKADEPVAKAAPAADAHVANTQSLFFEREAIDTDAGRDLDAKVKNWKESLSWREQQALDEARARGTEKPGMIGSLLRALGVR